MDDQNLPEKELEDIKKASSKILAGYVVAYKLLGFNKDRNIACMKELMDRRALGDDFNFEEYIEDQLKDAPKATDLKKISEILNKGMI